MPKDDYFTLSSTEWETAEKDYKVATEKWIANLRIRGPQGASPTVPNNRGYNGTFFVDYPGAPAKEKAPGESTPEAADAFNEYGEITP